MEFITHEIQQALRILKRNPLFVIFAALTLAIGIGMITAVYTLADALLLRPLAADRPEELVRMYSRMADGAVQRRFSYPDYQDLRDRSHSFSAVGAVSLVPFQLDVENDRTQILGEAVSANYFPMLNIAPFKGTLSFSETGAAAAVISYTAWKQKFSSDPEILHRSLRLNGKTYDIIAVMNQNFGGTYAGARIDVWIPFSSAPNLLGLNWQRDRAKPQLQLIARLKQGVNSEQAYAELNAIAAHLENRNASKKFRLVPPR
jgi:hypothetical protein